MVNVSFYFVTLIFDVFLSPFSFTFDGELKMIFTKKSNDQVNFEFHSSATLMQIFFLNI